MSLPVLLYAAQVKQLTQKRIVRTGHAILTLPSDVADYAVEMIQEAHRMIISMQEQVRTIRRRQRARRQQKTRQLPRMKQAHTEPMDESESVRSVSSTADVEMESDVSPSSPEQDEDDPISRATAPALRLGEGQIKDSKKLETLTEQIKLLKEQMELFAKAKQNAGSPAAVRSSSVPSPVSIPPAPLSSISDAPAMSIDTTIPIAPPLDLDIPMAPPLDDATTITIQNPFTPFTPVRLVNTISQSSSSMNHTPSPISMEQFSSPDPTSSETSSPAPSDDISDDSCSMDQENVSSQAPTMQPPQQRQPFRNVTNQTSNRSMQASLLNKVVPSSPGQNPIKLRPTQPTLKRVFTRRIPGADVLSHNDLIKVSAKIKLRKTNVPRSPGGTPRKENVSNDPFANALFHKFKNVHAEAAASRRSIHSQSSSTSTSFPPHQRHSRTSFGHDENGEEWNTA